MLLPPSTIWGHWRQPCKWPVSNPGRTNWAKMLIFATFFLATVGWWWVHQLPTSAIGPLRPPITALGRAGGVGCGHWPPLWGCGNLFCNVAKFTPHGMCSRAHTCQLMLTCVWLGCMGFFMPNHVHIQCFCPHVPTHVDRHVFGLVAWVCSCQPMFTCVFAHMCQLMLTRGSM